jgi:23S rRNA (cytosine1962-C5)-methyltransferase
MFAASEYELLDFGDGRKLERFGRHVLDRPCPAAEGVPCVQRPAAWEQAVARYCRTDGDTGTWSAEGPSPDSWIVRHGATSFEMKLTPSGHVGLFPEQAEHWDWIAQQVRDAERPLNVLNLFAYTGGSTLAAAAAGAAVVHVDAAKNTVAWARRNAALSNLSDKPVRWLVDDAMKFVQRELRRGNRYDGLILDPPSYGHGSRGEPWQIDARLVELLALCAELTRGRPRFALLTCHSPGWGAAELRASLARVLASDALMECGQMRLTSADGRELDCGAFARASFAAARGPAR